MEIDQIMSAIEQQFRTFGGGRVSGNPIAAALKDQPMMFAAGVDVRKVVEFVAAALQVATCSTCDARMIRQLDGTWQCPIDRRHGDRMWPDEETSITVLKDRPNGWQKPG